MISVYIRLHDDAGPSTGRAESDRPGVTYNEAVDAGLDALKGAMIAAGFSLDFEETIGEWLAERRTPTGGRDA